MPPARRDGHPAHVRAAGPAPAGRAARRDGRRRRRGGGPRAAIARGDRPLPRAPARGRRRGRRSPRCGAPAPRRCGRRCPSRAASLAGDALDGGAAGRAALPRLPGGARRRCASCARRGIRLVVVSNWDVSLHERLAETGLAPLLDGAVASAELGAAKPDPAIFARGLELAGAARGGRLARRRLARGRRRRRARGGPDAGARGPRRRARAARRRADRGARRPTLICWMASVPPPSGSEPLLRPELPDGLPPERIPPPPGAAVRARRPARVAAVGAVRGDAGDARDRDPRRGARHAGRAARGLRRRARATRRRA